LSDSKSLRGAAPRSALAILLFAPLLLTACGGGGGGGDGASAAPDSSTAVQLGITDANGQAVAAEALAVAQQGAATAQFGGTLATAAQVDAAGIVAGPVGLGAVALRLLAMTPQVPAMATGVTETLTEPCSGGGTATLTATGSGGSAAVVGDSLTVSANNCIETIDGAQTRLHGALTLGVIAGSYDPASQVFPKDVTLGMRAENFSLNSAALNGTLTLRLVYTTAPSDSFTLTSPSLSWTQATATGSHSVTVANYSHHAERNSVSVRTTTVSGTVTTNSPRINAGIVSFDFSTPTPIVSDFRGVISAGSLRIAGRSSALLLTTTANDTFSLQVDTNGDGTFDSTRSVLRNQL